MRKIFSKKWWLISISCCVGAGIVYACADGWGEEYGVSNFAPEVFVDSAYSPFFYSYQFYYQMGYDENQNSRFNNHNLADWSGYFNNKVATRELRYMLESATQGAVDSAIRYQAWQSSSLPDSIQSFIFLKQKNDERTAAFLHYLSLAKRCEDFAVREIQYEWNYDSSKRNSKDPEAADLMKKSEAGYNGTNELFLKERYWFQMVRNAYFNFLPADAIASFNKHEKEMPHNTIYYRSLSYMAGAYSKMKSFSKSNYYFSKVYDGCDELKTTAHFSFHPQEQADWKATLAMCSNNAEQATLWQMLGVFYADEKEAITQIYQLDPKSNKLDLLLARAVNKYEQKFSYKGSTPIGEYEDSSRSKSGMRQLISKIADAGNTSKPGIWDMAAGYLNSLNAQYQTAKTYYAKAKKEISGNELAIAQLKLIEIINTIGEAKKIDSKLENEILADVKWLDGFKSKTSSKIRYADALAWLKQTVAAKYRAQHELAKAECFYTNTDAYADRNYAEKMKSFLSNPTKTDFEKLCTDLSSVKLADIYEFQAIQQVFKDSIENAILLMSKADSLGQFVLPANPFNGRILDCHDCDQQNPQKIKYSKLTFLNKIKELKDKVAAGTDTYINANLLANAYYNITHYGNDRPFYECKILGQGMSNPFYLSDAYRNMLINMSLPFKYYNLAIKNAQNDEQKAKSNYMLAKCERNQWYNQHVYNNSKNEYGDSKMVDFSVLSGFKNLKLYPKTKFYEEVIKECEYFKNYVEKQ